MALFPKGLREAEDTQSSMLILIVAVLFLAAVFAFYYFTAR